MRANCQIDRVKIGAKTLELRSIDGMLELNIDTTGENPVYLGLQPLTRQAVAGNAVAQHAAKMLTLLKDRDLMAHNSEVASARKAGRAASDNGDFLACGRRDRRAVIALHMLGSKAFERKDVHGIVYHATTAVHLAWMLAHKAADARQGVVLTNELDGIGVAPSLHQRDVAGNINMSRAAGNAGNLFCSVEPAAMMLNVMFKVVTETADGGKGHLARLVADGAIARIIDGLGRALDKRERVVVGISLKHILQKVIECTQSNSARRALAAALRRTHAYERCGELDRTWRERTHRQSAAECVMQIVHDRLRMAALHYVKSCHTVSPLRSNTQQVSRNLLVYLAFLLLLQ